MGRRFPRQFLPRRSAVSSLFSFWDTDTGAGCVRSLHSLHLFVRKVSLWRPLISLVSLCPHTVSTGIRWWTKMRQGKRTEKGEAARFLAFLVTLPSSRFQAMQCNEEQGRGKRRWEGRKKESHPSSLSLTHFPFPFHVMLGDLSHLNPKQWKGIEGNDW